MKTEPPFDRVLLRRDGSWQPITLEGFFELPLSERIRHVIERTVTFQRHGVEIDQKEALAALRRLRVPSA